MLREFIVQRLLRGVARRANNLRIAAMARRIAAREPAPTGAPIILFKASTGIDDLSWNSGFHLLTAWALRLQGIPVIHFACSAGMSHCVLGTSRDRPQKTPPCKSCKHQARTLYTSAATQWFSMHRDSRLEVALQGLNLQELSAFKWNAATVSPVMGNNGAALAGATADASEQDPGAEAPLALGELCLPSLRWILRRHHLHDDEGTRYLLREYILSAWNLAREFSHLLDEAAPRAVIVFNGQFFPEATARQVAARRGIRVITHEVGLQPGSAFFTDGDATAYPIDLPSDFELTEAQNTRLDGYLEQRFRGKFSMAGIKFWPKMQGLDQGFLELAGRFKHVVAVFTNVVFDTSQPHANVLFEDMFEWLDLVLAQSRLHPETLFVVRAHPDELRTRKASRETTADWFGRSGAQGAFNLAFVGPEESQSSYELIAKSKFVLVYNSTIGLEASLLGAPVLCAGRARYTQYPIVFFPSSIPEFESQLEEFLSTERIDVPPVFRRNARRFLYYQVFRTSLPFANFLRPSIRTSQTQLKSFRPDALLPGNSPAVRALLEGLLNAGEFVIDESVPAAAADAERAI